MLIRVATPEDLGRIDALLSASYPRLLRPDYPPSVLVMALPLISRANPALVSSGTYYVAEEAGAILGAGGWTPRRGGQAEVRHLVTDWRHQRQGLGRAILSHALEAARDVGMTTAHAAATRTAVPFYAAMGFTRLADIVVPLAPGIGFPAVSMRRAL
ncbi:MAG: GNAT family N-acetyltransferase [Limimaricola sp.]|uniref:GNAT family N-acetyltransferase n=1 Tax=Limimaricola sp. TaxID=2211665 RepID=UPI001D3BF185|nr:GNAT family N-acetyltransferase [Limimaricola sp.]MBI1416315.1 GNAT family N-acetyltransferase [Limimaricola sp.]